MGQLALGKGPASTGLAAMYKESTFQVRGFFSYNMFMHALSIFMCNTCVSIIKDKYSYCAG
jgi:hypothetical protein